MKSLANETITPEENGPDYEIKALTSLELMEVVADGSEEMQKGKSLKSDDVKRLLKYGLVDSKVIDKMSSVALVKTAYAIYDKANLAEQERKNL